MIIYTLKAKSLIKGIILTLVVMIGIVAIVLGITNSQSISVTGTNKELPIYYVDCPDKKAAITFDCAWGSDDIPDILSSLEKAKVKATFFIVGQWAEKFPDAVKAISEAGHDIANHSYSHLRMGAIDQARIKKEIAVCGDKLSEISGKKIDLFRPPYGDYNNSVVKIARDLGYHTIQWDVDSLDWKPGISQNDILSRITRKIKNGSIILFHNDTPHTAKILPNVISTLHKQGYELLPVSQLIIRDNYFIDFDGKQKRKE